MDLVQIMKSITRRTALKGPLLGLVGVSAPSIAEPTSSRPHVGYPYLDEEIVFEVISRSHFNLEGVKALVEKRPELANATWGRFGDFESAVEAASHVGRRDIVQYLLSKGAKPNILTYASLGAYDAVKNMIECSPGIQTTLGPHGISLLRHARAALRMQDKMSRSEIESSKQLIGYLESLGNANGEQYDDIS